MNKTEQSRRALERGDRAGGTSKHRRARQAAFVGKQQRKRKKRKR